MRNEQRYHSAQNQFERFRVLLELTGRFEFDFRRRGNYCFEQFEFLVCSKFNHIQWGRTCACAVACLCPHNSISNVVVSLTIHGRRLEGESNRTIWLLIPSAVSVGIAGVEQPYQVKRMIGGMGDMLFCKFWKAEIAMTPCSPSVHSKRHRVYVQNVPVWVGCRVFRHHAHMLKHVRMVPAHTGTFWTYTRRRVWSQILVCPRCCPQHAQTHHTTSHGDRQRKRDRERETRQEKTIQDKKTREDERREKRQDKKREEERQEKR